jgi:hypothetical protein
MISLVEVSLPPRVRRLVLDHPIPLTPLCMVVIASASRLAQGARAGRCSTVWRAERVIRPARETIRSRSRLGSPSSGGMFGECEQLRPGGEFAGQGDEGAPDPVLVELVQGQVAQPAVLGAAPPRRVRRTAGVPRLLAAAACTPGTVHMVRGRLAQFGFLPGPDGRTWWFAREPGP